MYWLGEFDTSGPAVVTVIIIMPVSSLTTGAGHCFIFFVFFRFVFFFFFLPFLGVFFVVVVVCVVIVVVD